MRHQNKQRKREEWQRKIHDLADQFLNEARANGSPFSENLCNWAIDQARQMCPAPD